ncbi:MAG: thiol:disulfide interchange protein DsbA/DsbL [Gammaproteobacteria bacterium]
MHALIGCAFINRRGVAETAINKLLLPCLLALGLAAGTTFAASLTPPYKEGVNYIPVMPAQPVNVNPGRIEVLEFFWYGNPQCFALEPYLQSWDKNKAANVVLSRVPAALNPQWDLAARAYYAAVQLGISDKADAVIYAIIHTRHANLSTTADYENVFTGQLGVSAKQFETVWNSLVVDTQIAQAKVLAQRYGVTSVPALTVNGKWLTGAGYKLPTADIMNAVNWLVQREQAALPAGAD